MTLPATNFPGLDPLLQSGVIAVVRLTEQWLERLGAVPQPSEPYAEGCAPSLRLR